MALNLYRSTTSDPRKRRRLRLLGITDQDRLKFSRYT